MGKWGGDRLRNFEVFSVDSDMKHDMMDEGSIRGEWVGKAR
jgi:hypothetical protein